MPFSNSSSSDPRPCRYAPRASWWNNRTLFASAATVVALLIFGCDSGAPIEARKANTAPEGAALVRDDIKGKIDRAGEISAHRLPREALDTLRLIQSRGPFPYPKDGAVFGNREKHLPSRPRGYYSEYTVATPGSHDRGARRVVAGQGAGADPATSGEYWYTDDHYQSFRRIRDVPPH
jgi:ribonuclease T1